jgi:neopullulanase
MLNCCVKNLTLNCFLIFAMVTKVSGNEIIDRFEPLNWWVGMKNKNLQLMIHGKKVAEADIKINYPGVTFTGTEKTNNPNYQFLNISIGPEAKSGYIKITLSKSGSRDTIIQYPLLDRTGDDSLHKGFSSEDAIYLITPDRFANGNPENDNVRGYPDKANRSKPHSRHGGDIKGIMDHLDYIEKLGFTAIWVTPLLENNMHSYSYHGYSITDFYKVDPRFGSNEDYFDLARKCHKSGMKLIMDMVLNHCGSKHWWDGDLPASDWYHDSAVFLNTNFRASTLIDPYASDYDKNEFSNGWFDSSMPDLNQKNKWLARYLIQNTIWWIEASGIDGIRLDTQPYSDMQFLLGWMKAITAEYPYFTVVGEAWFQHESFTAGFQKNEKLPGTYRSDIPCVTDFPLCFALQNAVNEKEGWTEGMPKIYHVLAQDFLYGDPMNNLIFLDNHDLPRIFEFLRGDLRKLKMLLGILATMRGIPQFYYGTEVLLQGDKAKDDGFVRKDMPGGWLGDHKNAFTEENLNDEQRQALNYTRSLFNWRKQNKIIAEGALKQFLPNDGLYVYARYNQKGTVLVLVNNNERHTVKFKTDRYAEVLKGTHIAREIISKNVIDLTTLQISPKTTLILEFDK